MSLSGILKARTLREFRIPFDKIPKDEKKIKAQFGDFTFEQIHPEDVSLREKVFDFMQETFYREAPIPIALNLARKDCPRTEDFVRKEVDDHIDSGISIALMDNNENVKGVNLNKLYNKDPNYRVIGGSIKDWHRAAAELARGTEHPHIEWRKYQNEHIYDLGQKLTRQQGLNGAVYLSMGTISKDLRNGNMWWQVISSSIRHVVRGNRTAYFQMNFRKTNENILENLKQVDGMMYEEETLEDKGQRCFEKIQHLGGIRFFVVPR